MTTHDDIRPIVIEHVTIVSRWSYDETEARLHAAVPHVDAEIEELIATENWDRLKAMLPSAPRLSIFSS